MNYQRLQASVRKHEGYRQLPYQDSLGYFTVGFGHLVHDIKLDAVANYQTLGNLLKWISDPVNHEAWLRSDLLEAEADARGYVGESWDKLSDIRKETLTELAFQLGSQRLGGFVKMREAIVSGRWMRAHDELLDSKLAEQTPKRAKELARRLLEG